MGDLSGRLEAMTGSLYYQIRGGHESNDKKLKMEENRNDILRVTSELENRYEITKKMIKEINELMCKMQYDRKQFIIQEVQGALDCVFEEDYKIDLELETYKDGYKSELLVYIEKDGKREYINPNTQNGGLCRQVICASTSIAIAKLMGCKMLLWDEAFNGGDAVKLRKVQPIIKSFLDYNEENFIIMNEHSPEVYKDLPCRVFKILKNGIGFNGNVEIVEIEDREGTQLNEVELEW